MDRRDFLKTVAITGAAMTIQRSEAMEILTQTINKANGDKPDLVAVMGGEPEAMFRRAISELGGMKQFIKPGQKVVVKPNIGWDKAVSYTHLDVYKRQDNCLGTEFRLRPRYLYRT